MAYRHIETTKRQNDLKNMQKHCRLCKKKLEGNTSSLKRYKWLQRDRKQPQRKQRTKVLINYNKNTQSDYKWRISSCCSHCVSISAWAVPLYSSSVVEPLTCLCPGAHCLILCSWPVLPRNYKVFSQSRVKKHHNLFFFPWCCWQLSMWKEKKI